MKTALLALSLALVSQASFAQRAGGGYERTLQCRAITSAAKNISVALKVTTAAVSPEFNIRGAAVEITRFDLKNGNKQLVALKQTHQTAYDAAFKSNDIVVQIDKKPTIHATLTMGFSDYSCK